jgi:hypothetical protein
MCATREHSTPPPYATPGGFTGCVHATLTISHAQCAVVFSHNGIAEVLVLPEYVANTTRSGLTTGLQRYGPQSTQEGRARPDELVYPRTLIITSSPAPSQFNISLSWYSHNPQTEPRRTQVKPISCK